MDSMDCMNSIANLFSDFIVAPTHIAGSKGGIFWPKKFRHAFAKQEGYLSITREAWKHGTCAVD